jgi:hypothetical protein
MNIEYSTEQKENRELGARYRDDVKEGTDYVVLYRDVIKTHCVDIITRTHRIDEIVAGVKFARLCMSSVPLSTSGTC